MQSWRESVVSALTGELRTAQTRLDEACTARTLADSEYQSALGARNELYELLRAFREYAARQSEGGAA